MDDFYLSNFQKQRGQYQTFPEQLNAYTGLKTPLLSSYVRNGPRLLRKNHLPMQNLISERKRKQSRIE